MKNTKDCFLKVKNDYLQLLKKEKIYGKSLDSKIKNLKNFYIPMSFWIEKKYKEKGKTLFLGLSGGQGSGKTTIAKILKVILKNFFDREIHVSSIDDFYKTIEDREKMSNSIHHLFKTRGVPGTHNINLARKFFQIIKKKEFKNIKLPKFDKSTDDRTKKKYFFNIKKKPEIVILEGWCVGAKPQANFLINKPINTLEKNEDNKLVWRRYVNEKLKKEYKNFFSMIDHFIFIKVPNFKMVLKWRVLQENKLRKNLHSNKKIMTYKDIKRFTMLYQRITLQMIKDLTKSASMVMFLRKDHDVKKIIFRS